MRIALISEQFPPLRSSCAVQMRDLALELCEQGHKVTVLTPSRIERDWQIEDYRGVQVVRLKAFESRDRSYALRMVGEMAMPYTMWRRWRASPVGSECFDGIAWYSPHIFFGPLVARMKRASGCPAYLILRDIFPEWAADLGLIGRGPTYRFLQAVARYQYRLADVIGVQTPANLDFFAETPTVVKRVEVLQNWMRPNEVKDCSIRIDESQLAGRAIFVYAGNMGVAQGMEKLLDLAVALRDDPRAGFVFVGRGSLVEWMKSQVQERELSNTLIFGEIPPEEIPGLYAQAHVGLVALDSRHSWHNIPGKFISYMFAGLPVLAGINPGNDLIDLIARERVGFASTEPGGSDLAALARRMLADDFDTDQCASRCREVARTLFSSQAAASQVEAALIA